MDQYRYDPLPGPRSIRVLRFTNSPIKPREDDDSPESTRGSSQSQAGDEQIASEAESNRSAWSQPDDIECELIAAPLDDPRLRFVAFSYCWGVVDPDNLRRILINGKPLKLTPNPYNCLAQTWTGSASTRVFFWLDQVCIDQSNVEERASQVALMGDLYSRAEIVMVWLGAEEEVVEVTALAFGAARVFDGMTENMFGPRAFENAPLATKPRLLSSILQTSAEFLGPEFAQGGWAIEALARLAENPWFVRLWCLQEAVLAKRLSFAVGSTAVDAEFVLRVIHTIGNVIFYWGGLGSQAYRVDRIDSLKAIEQLTFLRARTRGHYSNEPADLVDIYPHATRRKFHDARDRVFALLGMQSHPIEQWGSYLRPDYTVDLKTVYRRFALYYLEKLKSLRILLLTTTRHASSQISLSTAQSGLPQVLDDWPSWMPQPYFEYPSARSTQLWNAGTAEESVIEVLSDTTIAVRGVIVDTIEDVANLSDWFVKVERLDQVSDWWAQMDAAWDETERIFEQVRQPYYTGESSEEVLLKTLFEAQSTYGDVQAFTVWRRCKKSRNPHNADDWTFDGDKEFKSFSNAFQVASWASNHRLAVTSQGYVAMVEVGVRPGDELCVFLGADPVYVLRQSIQGRSIVCPCYVHGLMNGEALGDDDRWPRQMVELR